MTTCKVCGNEDARITARKANGHLTDVCKRCLDKSRRTSKPLSVAVVWKESSDKNYSKEVQ